MDTFRRQHPGVVGYTYWGYRHGGRKTNRGIQSTFLNLIFFWLSLSLKWAFYGVDNICKILWCIRFQEFIIPSFSVIECVVILFPRINSCLKEFWNPMLHLNYSVNILLYKDVSIFNLSDINFITLLSSSLSV